MIWLPSHAARGPEEPLGSASGRTALAAAKTLHSPLAHARSSHAAASPRPEPSASRAAWREDATGGGCVACGAGPREARGRRGTEAARKPCTGAQEASEWGGCREPYCSWRGTAGLVRLLSLSAAAGSRRNRTSGGTGSGRTPSLLRTGPASRLRKVAAVAAPGVAVGAAGSKRRALESAGAAGQGSRRGACARCADLCTRTAGIPVRAVWRKRAGALAAPETRESPTRPSARSLVALRRLPCLGVAGLLRGSNGVLSSAYVLTNENK